MKSIGLISCLLWAMCSCEQSTASALQQIKADSTDLPASLDSWTEIEKGYKSIHAFVALCDNENQGIVPVPKTLGNGQDPKSNLYWGALYGVRTHFTRSADWDLITELPSTNPSILSRVVFKHKRSETYLLADAYDGAAIRQCTEDMLNSLAQRHPVQIEISGDSLLFGDRADLVTYVGHNGLMDFELDLDLRRENPQPRDVIILACASSSYFSPHVQSAHANPVLWTNSLMAPEAYVLEAATDKWLQELSGESVKEAAAQAYNRYQKCGINGARNLFRTGYP